MIHILIDIIYNLGYYTWQWLKSHPKFKSNQIYIGGDSYSGLTVPPLVQKIADGMSGISIWYEINRLKPRGDDRVDNNGAVKI